MAHRVAARARRACVRLLRRTSLFLQSADEQNAASVDGFRVGKAWTELHAPCMIEVGTARLRYRSLIADADNQPTQMAPSPRRCRRRRAVLAECGPARARRCRWQGRLRLPRRAMQRSHSAGRPAAAAAAHGGLNSRPCPPVAPMARRPASQSGGSPPVAFPKAERPFKPGEFASPADVDESTRIAPLERRAAVVSRRAPIRVPLQAQPAAGDDPSTRPEAARVVRAHRRGPPPPAEPAVRTARWACRARRSRA